jgi:predicted nucleotidyltransferase
MRLALEEQAAIREAVHSADADARVYLFGSRVDDNARGGDINLLVLSKKINVMAKIQILALLHQQLGERKIDVAVFADANRPFAKMALEHGVLL